MHMHGPSQALLTYSGAEWGGGVLRTPSWRWVKALNKRLDEHCPEEELAAAAREEEAKEATQLHDNTLTQHYAAR